LATLDVKQVLKVLQSSLPETLLENYGLASTQTSNVSSIQEIMQQLIALKTDELFCAGTSRATREISKSGVKVYTYHFDRGNQFKGPLNGIAHHAIDLEYVFGNFLKGFTDKKDVDLSKALMRFWIGFANGKEPWSEYSTGKALHITSNAECTVVPRGEVKSRRWAAYAEMEKNWAQVRRTGNMLMNAKLEDPAP
jgi:carboxylesterase type B